MGCGGRGSRALRPGRAILGVLSVPQTGVHSAWKRAEDAQRDADMTRLAPACKDPPRALCLGAPFRGFRGDPVAAGQRMPD